MQEIVPYISCLCSEDEFPEVVQGNHADIYIKTSEGVLLHKKLVGDRHVRLKVRHIPKKVAECLGVEEKITEELNFLPNGKIPISFLHQIVRFFKEVMKVKASDYEAHAFILWSQERGYFISVPKQSVTKASVTFTYDKDAIPDGSVIVVDIHSHNTMGAIQ
jgi:hypothetical protein